MVRPQAYKPVNCAAYGCKNQSANRLIAVLFGCTAASDHKDE